MSTSELSFCLETSFHQVAKRQSWVVWCELSIISRSPPCFSPSFSSLDLIALSCLVGRVVLSLGVVILTVTSTIAAFLTSTTAGSPSFPLISSYTVILPKSAHPLTCPSHSFQIYKRNIADPP